MNYSRKNSERRISNRTAEGPLHRSIARAPDYRTLLTISGLVLLFAVNVWLLHSCINGGQPAVPPMHGGPVPFAAIRAPRPEVPSLAGLELNVPFLVPGLEEIDPAYAPSLTPELTTLVFSGAGMGKGNYDLYLAKRAAAADPFMAPVKIHSCSSSQPETFPSLSTDGLELLFLRFDSQPRLFYSRRNSLDAEFSASVPWEAAARLARDRHPGGAQFIDSRHVQFVTRGQKPSEDRQILMVDRETKQSKFAIPVLLKFTQAPVPQFLSVDRLRSYFGAPDGLLLAARRTDSEPFGPPIRFCDVPADGPVWVTPKEDVIFFCSPGPGKQVESSKRLWVLCF